MWRGEYGPYAYDYKATRVLELERGASIYEASMEGKQKGSDGTMRQREPKSVSDLFIFRLLIIRE